MRSVLSQETVKPLNVEARALYFVLLKKEQLIVKNQFIIDLPNRPPYKVA
jgi:hypothetical protein